MSTTKTNKKKATSKKQFPVMQVLLPLVLIALGVLLIWKKDMLNQVFTAIGVVIALVGLIDTVIYCATKQYEKKPTYLASGIGLLIVGGILIVIPFFADTFIPFCMGLFTLISGVSGIMDAAQIRKFGSSDWQIPMAFSILITLMGIGILICTWHLSGVVWIVMGVMLIVSGVMRLVHTIISANARKHYHPDTIIEGEATEI